MHFSLPALPARCVVGLAVLWLHSSSAAAGRTLRATVITSSWSEAGVTWLNQPGSGPPQADAPSRTGWVEFAVTPAVQQMYTGTNEGFLLRDMNEDSVMAQAQVFSSREGADPPQLVITFN